MVIKQGAVRKHSLSVHMRHFSLALEQPPNPSGWRNHQHTLMPFLFKHQDQVHRRFFLVQTGTLKWSLKFTSFLLVLLLDIHWQNSFSLLNWTKPFKNDKTTDCAICRSDLILIPLISATVWQFNFSGKIRLIKQWTLIKIDCS